ncbi:MAG: SsrA-binding protein SmpB [Candidatus Omnitrophica bacterium]|nr:SsrA-binding protein SmpB [Candidatus Omnitrophota bacterium]
MNPIAVNRKALYDFFLFDKYEAGISLLGHEVKSIREGRVNLRDSFVRIANGEAFLVNCHISPYSKIQGYVETDPTRSRKLLLHRHEIDRLIGQSRQKGFAIIPLRLYFKKGRVKMEIALAKGKKQYDRRETIKRRIHERESSAAIKRSMRRGR